jgi:hypothetical protein
VHTLIRSTVVAAVLTAFVGFGALPTRAADEFVITGEVTGLYPGIVTMVSADVTNPFEITLRVISVSAVPSAPSDGCSDQHLVVEPAAPDALLAAGARTSVPLDVTLDRSAPDACQGATFQLEFQGAAVALDPTPLPTTGADTRLVAAIALVVVGLGAIAVRRGRSVAP